MTRSADAPNMLAWMIWAVAGPPALCALALSSLRPADGPWGLTVALCAVLLGLLALAHRPMRWRARAVMVALPLFLFTWPEMALRVAGYRHDHALSIQFGYPPPDVMVRLRHDPELFWKLPLGHPGSNSLGFLGPEFEIPKPPGTYRMVFFGDSCTMQGYPAMVPSALEAKDGEVYDTINFGVGGYSSHQGVVIAERWAKQLEPDLGIVFFGWNDHWLAYGAPDSDKALSGWRLALQSAVRASRTAQWLTSGDTAGSVAPLDVPRVSAEEYALNLETIGDLVEGAGGRVLLLTAPTSMFELGVPAYLIPTFAEDGAAVLDQHRAYNEVVRAVAGRRGWRLLDLAAEFPSERASELIAADRIHFTEEAGLAWVAELIAREVAEFTK